MKKIFFLLQLSITFSHFAIAQQPTSQPTNLVFNSVKPYNFILSFTPSTADGFLILKSTQPITDVPVDGTTYEKGQGLTSCKVVNTSAGTSFTVREVLERTKYYFKIFAFNGSGGSINYLQINPLTDSVTTPAADAGNYYQSIDSTSPSFIADLHDLINNHTQLTYTPGYANSLMPIMYERDTVGGQEAINCEYSGETTIYTPPFAFVAADYNREHVLCKSWMQTAAIYGASNLIDYAEGADYYNLLLTRSVPNVKRSNNPLGIVVNQTWSYGSSKYGTDNTGNNVFEPRADRKGDAARNMMYEMVCYDGLSGGWGLNELLSQAYQQDQNILKLWNQQDPPDKFERTKNACINSVQHNRNPFIDHPQWATCINFDSLIKTNLCGAASGVEQVFSDAAIRLFPNPASQIFNIEIETADFHEAEVAVFDMYGRKILQSIITEPKASFDLANVEAGNYLLYLAINHQTAIKKLVVIH